MATLDTATTNGSANPSSPVPLDTIPISPANGTSGPNALNGGADGTNDENSPLNGAGLQKEHKDGEQITVFHDPDNFNVKHPLMHEWTLWFTKPPSGKVCASLCFVYNISVTTLTGDS